MTQVNVSGNLCSIVGLFDNPIGAGEERYGETERPRCTAMSDFGKVDNRSPQLFGATQTANH